MGSSDSLTERLASYQRDRTINNNNNNSNNKSDDDDDDDDEYEVRIAWSSGSTTTTTNNNNNNNSTHLDKNDKEHDTASLSNSLSSFSVAAFSINRDADELLSLKKYEEAIKLFSKAIQIVNETNKKNNTNNDNTDNNNNTTHCAIPLSNRSFAYLQLARALQTHNSNTTTNNNSSSSSIKSASYYVRQSIKDAEELCTLCPFWSTAYQRYSLNNNNTNNIFID